MLQTPEGPRLLTPGVVIDGARFEEWTDLRIQSSVFSPPASFQMGTGPLSGKLMDALLPPRPITIYFGDGSTGGDVEILTGWLERNDDDYEKGAEYFQISGRDRVSDLIENSVPEDLAVKGRCLYDILTDIGDVLGLTILCTNEANRLAVVDRKKLKQLMAVWGASQLPYNSNVVAIQRLLVNTLESVDAKDRQFKSILATNGIVPTLRPPRMTGIFKSLDEAEPKDGESCWDFVGRYAIRLEALLWGSADGNVIISRPQYDQEPSYTLLNLERDPLKNNVIRRSIPIDVSGMAMEQKRTGKTIKVGEKKERLQSLMQSSHLVSGATNDLTAGILGVPAGFNRKRWGRDTEARNLDELDRRNYYDMLAADTGFMSIDVTVMGWDQGGRVYTPDTVCRYVEDRRGIDGLFYISDVEYTLGPKTGAMEGPRSRLSLRLLDSWSPSQ
jgi:prophage tail gpP-like protein